MDFGGNRLYSFKTENCFTSKSNSSLARFNRACHRSEFRNDEIKAIINHFNAASFTWFIETDDHKSADLLDKHGFIKYPALFSAMKADIANIADHDYGSHIAVKEISQKEDVQTLINIIACNDPQYPKYEWEKGIYDLLEKGSQSIKLYLGFYEGEPCATSIIIYHGDAVTLHLINTLPEYRCKGLGYAVTHKALFDAARNGMTQAILTASSLGQSLYQKLGFTEYTQYHIYIYKK